MKGLLAVILAAGKGVRMRSNLPKVLHEIGGKPIVEYVLSTAESLGIDKVIVVIGHQHELVKEKLKNWDVEFVLQKEQLGTGHAVMKTKELLKDFGGDVLVLCGDVPFLKKETIKDLVSLHKKTKAKGTVLTAILENPKGYGRIIRDKNDLVERIVEEVDATPEEKKIKEINTGTYCFDSQYLFAYLNLVKVDNLQKEYYLTDVLRLFRKDNLTVAAQIAPNPDEVEGINSLEQLKKMERIFNQQMSKKSVY